MIKKIFYLICIVFVIFSYAVSDTLDSSFVQSDIADTVSIINDSTVQISQDILAENKTSYKVTKTLVYEVKDNKENCYIGEVNKSGTSAALIIATKKKNHLIFNGIEDKKYDEIVAVYISPSGSRVGYFAKNKKNYYAVIDSKEYGKYAELIDSIYFSPDETQFFYEATKKGILGNKPLIILNGVEKIFTNVLATLPGHFTPLSGYPVYFTREGKKCRAYINEIKGKKYDVTGVGPIFSENSDIVGYSGSRNDTVYVVIDNQEIGGYTRVTELAFSTDGSEYAYVAYINHDAYVFKGAEKFGPYDDAYHPTYSADGNHFVFTAKRDSSIFMVYDASEQSYHLDTGEPILSPDGNRLAYMVFIELAELTGTNRQVAVIDGVQQKEYTFVYRTELTFSPDSKHFGYLADKDSLRVVAVIDGVEGKEYKNIYNIVFNPNNNGYAYNAEVNDTTWAIVIDGEENGRYYRVSKPVYSADGNNIAYTVVDEMQWKLVVNGKMFDSYRDLQPLIPQFDKQNMLHLFGEKSRQKIYQLLFEPEKN